MLKTPGSARKFELGGDPAAEAEAFQTGEAFPKAQDTVQRAVLTLLPGIPIPAEERILGEAHVLLALMPTVAPGASLLQEETLNGIGDVA